MKVYTVSKGEDNEGGFIVDVFADYNKARQYVIDNNFCFIVKTTGIMVVTI